MVVMISYARSGGTLLNKILSSFSKLIVISEISEIGGGGSDNALKTVNSQAKSWYGYDLSSDEFYKSIVELNKHAEQDEKILILRDWTYINYPIYDEVPEQYSEKLQVMQLDKHIKDIKYFTFTRNAIDVWISMDCPDVKSFGEKYLKYINSINKSKLKVFKYEDLVCNPEQIISDIVNYFSTDLIYKNNFYNSKNVHGDIQTKSRGSMLKSIKRLPRKPIGILNMIRLIRCDAIKQANIIMGYPVGYYDKERESNVLYFVLLIIIESLKDISKYLKYLIKGRPVVGAKIDNVHLANVLRKN